MSGLPIQLVNPVEPGSKSCGIAEALARCSGGAGSCELTLTGPCTAPARANWTSTNLIDLSGANHVVLNGNGDVAPITFSGSTGTSSPTYIVKLGAATDIEVKNLNVTFHDTCTSNCNKTAAGIEMDGLAANIRIHDNKLAITEAVTSDTSLACYREIWILGDIVPTPDNNPEQIKIYHNTLSHSCRGIEIQGGDYVSITDNDMDGQGRPDDSNNLTPVGYQVLKYEGVGVVVTGNKFDMSLNGYTNVPNFACLGLSNDSGDTSAAGTNKGIMFNSNQCFGMRDSHEVAVDVSGYDSAVIVGNRFQGGQCASSATLSCYVDEDCSAVGGVCNTSNQKGITFTGDATAGNSRNRNNMVSNNVFDGYQDDNSTICPIWYSSITGSDPLENADNTTKNNHFRLNDSAQDGFCGDAAVRDRNHYSGNTVQGSTAIPADNDSVYSNCIVATPMAQNLFFWKVPTGVTAHVKRVWCITSVAAGTAPLYTPRECNSTGGSCASIGSQISCATTGNSSTLTDTSLASDAMIDLQSGNTGSVTGNVLVCMDWNPQ